MENDVFQLEASSRTVGEYVLRRGKIFDFTPRAGKITISPQEFQAANSSVVPIPIDIEHRVTPLSGKIGHLIHYEIRGNEVFGEVAWKKAFDDLINGPKSVSCHFDPTSKKLIGLGVVCNPAIEDAALYAACDFTAPARTDTVQQKLQGIHDLAAGHPGICNPGSANSKYGDLSNEVKALQSIHDTSVQHGANCIGGANLLNKGNKLNNEDTALQQELARLRSSMEAELLRRKQSDEKRILAESSAFADRMVSEDRAAPGERAEIANEYAEYAREELESGPLVTFNDGKNFISGTRLERFIHRWKSKPAQPYSKVLMDGGIFRSNKKVNGSLDKDKDPEYLSDKQYFASLTGNGQSGK